MRSYISRKTCVRWFLLALTLCALVLPDVASAQSQSAEILAMEREGDYFEFRCSVMEVHRDHLVVCEEVIDLVDFRRGRYRYETMLRDHLGRSLTLNAFMKDHWVFIRGFELRNGHIAAREIYRLPRYMTDKQARKAFSFVREVPRWEPQL